MPHFDEDRQSKKIDEFHKREEEELAKMLAEKYGVSYVDLSVTSIDADALRPIPEETARRALMSPFHIIEKKLFIAVHSPQKEATQFAITELEQRGYTVVIFIASMASIERAWARYKELSFSKGSHAGIIEISNEDILYFFERIQSFHDITTILGEIQESNQRTHHMSRVLEVTLAGALSTDASDIHMEPEETRARLRLRLDGVLHDITFFDEPTYKLILSRIKLVSGMKLNITDIAQDGRFSLRIKGIEVEIRASVLPGTYGESVVLRLLNPKIINIPFEKLGIEPFLEEIVLRQLQKPNGMILTTGPTGSGKSTSLYAFMKKLYTPEMKIITIENPIEYHLPGIVQTQTEEKKGYTFLEGLKHALRQDPDIIMIGEIRDTETARTAMDSSLTGHLVFSTLHTNNAAGAIPRLVGLGVSPKIISSAVNLAMAQRLIRLLCQYCKKEVKQTLEERYIIDRILGGIVARSVKNTGMLWKPGICEKCNGTGYKGQIGLYEGILIDSNIEDMIRQNPSDRDIKKVSRRQGILDIHEDGMIKVIKGMTALEELYRIVDMSGER